VLGFADPCDGELHEVEKILTAEIAENGAESAEKIESSLWRLLVVLRVLGFISLRSLRLKAFYLVTQASLFAGEQLRACVAWR
jgi:hypothetical protein